MNLNKNTIIIFLVLVFIVGYSQYEFEQSKEYSLPDRTILFLDENIFKLYQKKYDVDKDFNPYWGFAKEVDMLAEGVDALEEQNITSKQEVKITQPKGKNVLCIEESCYRLLGIHYNKKTPIVTLYNKNLKEKIKDYKRKELLDSTIIVNKIYSHSVEFLNKQTNQKWHFKLFDVNQTKYIPKEIQE